MPLQCLKVRLKPGTEARVAEWAAELNRRRPEVMATLEAEGVTLEAAFLDKQADATYLIYVMQADSFEQAVAVGKASAAPIDAYHREFKQACWDERTQLPVLVEFARNGAKVG